MNQIFKPDPLTNWSVKCLLPTISSLSEPSERILSDGYDVESLILLLV